MPTARPCKICGEPQQTKEQYEAHIDIHRSPRSKLIYKHYKNNKALGYRFLQCSKCKEFDLISVNASNCSKRCAAAAARGTHLPPLHDYTTELIETDIQGETYVVECVTCTYCSRIIYSSHCYLCGDPMDLNAKPPKAMASVLVYLVGKEHTLRNVKRSHYRCAAVLYAEPNLFT